MLGQPNRNLSATAFYFPIYFCLSSLLFLIVCLLFLSLRGEQYVSLFFHELKAFSVFHLSIFFLFNIRWQQHVNPLGHQCIVPPSLFEHKRNHPTAANNNKASLRRAQSPQVSLFCRQQKDQQHNAAVPKHQQRQISVFVSKYKNRLVNGRN